MDEFYLPEETIEWLSLKKSEYLSKLIEKIAGDDIQFEEYTRFDDMIPATLSGPDWTAETIEDKQRIKTFGRTFADPEVLHQVVVGALVADQKQSDVFVPIISFVTRSETVAKLFNAGIVSRPTMN